MSKENYTINQTISRKGFITERKFVETSLAKNSGYYDLERRLGYHTGRLSEGFYLAHLIKLPAYYEFENRGYSIVPGHDFVKNKTELIFSRNDAEIFVNNIQLPVITDYLKVELLTATKKEIIIPKDILNNYVIKEWEKKGGAKNLVKVIPFTQHSKFMETDFQYPQGSGIPQWELISPKDFKIYKIFESKQQYLMVI